MQRIAMWSGPRNISTAMMRSWGNRPDTYVCDEPLYAYYLLRSGANHPGADEVIAHQENDWRKVTQWLTEHQPPGKSLFYQKHMTHHLLPDIDRRWIDKLTNCFLIRTPREVISSYIKKNSHMDIVDTGFPQQWEIFCWVRDHTGQIPPVIDARDVLENPRQTLSRLCDAVGVTFSDAMLEWPPGLRDTDGVWAKHWYHEVEKSTSFQPYRPKTIDLPDHMQGLAARCDEFYEQLHSHRLR